VGASGLDVSSNFFGTLGAKLAQGREFSEQEDRYHGEPVVIISHRLWQDQFAGLRAPHRSAVLFDRQVVSYQIGSLSPSPTLWTSQVERSSHTISYFSGPAIETYPSIAGGDGPATPSFLMVDSTAPPGTEYSCHRLKRVVASRHAQQQRSSIAPHSASLIYD
jgi:hypothetical protein